MESNVMIQSFGFLEEGREVFCYTLKNRKGMEVDIMNLGAAITACRIPLKKGNCVDVVAGFDSIKDYEASYRLNGAPYFGAIVGRSTGRIRNGRFELNGKSIQLQRNWGDHHIHGGTKGFSTAYWEVTAIYNQENPSITLQYKSAHNEENYPGTLTTEVSYTLTENNAICVSIQSTTTEDTIVNLTQHSYFNLNGHDQRVDRRHTLYVNSLELLETDSENIPTGAYVDLAGHPHFYKRTKDCPSQIDDSFLLPKDKSVKAILKSTKNGLKLCVTTDQPVLHVYVGGNCYNHIPGKDGAMYHATSGICFETQHPQDAPNHTHFPSTLLKKGETYHHTTTYQFEQL